MVNHLVLWYNHILKITHLYIAKFKFDVLSLTLPPVILRSEDTKVFLYLTWT